MNPAGGTCVGNTLPLTVNSSIPPLPWYAHERCSQPTSTGVLTSWGGALVPLLSLTPLVYGPNTPEVPLRPLMSRPQTRLPLGVPIGLPSSIKECSAVQLLAPM